MRENGQPSRPVPMKLATIWRALCIVPVPTVQIPLIMALFNKGLISSSFAVLVRAHPFSAKQRVHFTVKKKVLVSNRMCECNGTSHVSQCQSQLCESPQLVQAEIEAAAVFLQRFRLYAAAHAKGRNTGRAALNGDAGRACANETHVDPIKQNKNGTHLAIGTCPTAQRLARGRQCTRAWPVRSSPP